MKWCFYFFRYALVFVRELIFANIQVARLVMSPQLKIRPGFLAIPMEAQSDFEVTSLANSITLTPGTLSVDVSDDNKYLYIHAIDCADPDAIRKSIAEGFETKIREAFA